MVPLHLWGSLVSFKPHGVSAGKTGARHTLEGNSTSLPTPIEVEITCRYLACTATALRREPTTSSHPHSQVGYSHLLTAYKQTNYNMFTQ